MDFCVLLSALYGGFAERIFERVKKHIGIYGVEFWVALERQDFFADFQAFDGAEIGAREDFGIVWLIYHNVVVAVLEREFAVREIFFLKGRFYLGKPLADSPAVRIGRNFPAEGVGDYLVSEAYPDLLGIAPPESRYDELL